MMTKQEFRTIGQSFFQAAVTASDEPRVTNVGRRTHTERSPRQCLIDGGMAALELADQAPDEHGGQFS